MQKQVCFLLLLAASGAPRLFAKPDYRFDGQISREVLENYLSRSITMTEMYRSPGNLDDDIRMLKNIGAKFAGRTIYLWGGDARIADPRFLAQGREMAARIHRNDPDVVLQAAVFEIVTEAVGQVPIADWVFREFAQTPETRNFDYSKMLFPDKRFVDHWRRGSSVPDICQMETKMWFFFLAASYMNVGIEAIHFGQLDLIGRNDPEHRNWADLLKHVRGYAAKNARRHYVICDAHVPKGGPILEGRLLLDFHSFPLRPKEVADSPQKAVLEVGYSDGLYGRSNGGIAPSGWKCDHLPYLVEFDNFGGTRTPGQASQSRGASIFTWGYDEITWLAHQPEAYRNEWLRYAWNWLKEHDRNGFLEMPGGRMLTNGPPNPSEGGGRINWYFANTRSPEFPGGFSQEETIKAIWLADSNLSASVDVDPSTLDNKVLLGYQGWFACPADGSQRWTHWSRGAPTADTLTVELYPDLSELDPNERCEIPGMTIGGNPAYLFSSRNQKTVSRHFRWMKEYGLDGVLVQRFVGEIRRKRAEGDVVLKNIMAAAKESGRAFAIEYDISGGNPETFAQTLKDDWVYLVDELKVTAHPNYQRHNGKPVLSVWGMGLSDDNHPPADSGAAKDLIEWFQAKAPAQCRVTYMGGTPSRWRTLTADSRNDPAWAKTYAAMDVVQPWNVGRYGTLDAVDRWKEDVLIPDVKLAAANHQIYMPVIFPGFSWHNLKRTAKENQIPRLRGEFLWRQAYNARLAGAKVLKIAMFDEVDEGTAILKLAPHRKDAPDQGFWLTLDADGAELPSDWYLRLAGEITRMFHGDIEPDPKLPANPGPHR